MVAFAPGIFGEGTDVPNYETLKKRRQIADLLAARSMQGTPKNIGEGINSLGQAIAGRVMDRKLVGQEEAAHKSAADIIAGIIGGGGGYSGNPSSMGPPMFDGEPVAPTGSNPYASAISGIESGGNYGALGPDVKGDRAYGKYQVMGANIPEWTQEALGQSMDPQAFLADPKAQDAVFNHKFGGYVDQYGPEGAASMWFSGDPTPDGDSDGYTKDTDYVQKFMGALGGGGMLGGGEPDMAVVSQLAQVLGNPYADEGQKAVAKALIERQMADSGITPYQAAQLGMDQQRLRFEMEQANKPAPQSTMISPEEEAALGLPEAGTYQRSPTGEITTAYAAPDAPKDPTTVQEYQFYAQQEQGAGRQPKSYDQWLVETKKAGAASNNTTIVGENSLRKKLGEGEGELWASYAEAGGVSAAANADFEMLDALVGVAPQGPIPGNFAKLFPGVSSSGAAFQSVIKRIAPTLRAPGSGSTSDIEYKGMRGLATSRKPTR
jgi:hypothetical protein